MKLRKLMLLILALVSTFSLKAQQPTIGEIYGLTTYLQYGGGIGVYNPNTPGDFTPKIFDFKLQRAFVDNYRYNVGGALAVQRNNQAGTLGGDFSNYHTDDYLQLLKDNDITVIWATQGKFAEQNTVGTASKVMPINEADDPLLPSSWTVLAEHVKQLTIRYGKDIDPADSVFINTWQPGDYRDNEELYNMDLLEWIEIQNEWDFKAAWSGATRTITPQGYAACFKASYDSIRRYSDSMKIIMGGGIGASIENIDTFLTTLEALYAPDPMPTDFYLNFHWYMRRNSTEQGFDPDVGASPEFVDAYGFGRRMDSINSVWGTSGWFCTETGWSAALPPIDAGRNSAPIQQGTTQLQSQGYLMIRLALAWNAWESCKGITFWHARDGYDSGAYEFGGVCYDDDGARGTTEWDDKPAKTLSVSFLDTYKDYRVTQYGEYFSGFRANVTDGVSQATLVWSDSANVGPLTPIPTVETAGAAIGGRGCVSPKATFGNSKVFYNQSSYPVGGIRILQYATPRKNVDGIRQQMLMTVYYPPEGQALDSVAWFWIHGGGFRGGSLFDEDGVYLMTKHANQGGIGVMVEYRTGWSTCQDENPIFCFSREDTNKFAEATVLAEKDVRDAIRFLDANKDSLGIAYAMDSLFIAGTSAGGSLASFLLLTEDDFIDSFNVKGGYIGYGGLGNQTYIPQGRWLRGTTLTKNRIIGSRAKDLAIYISHNNLDTIAPWTDGEIYKCDFYANNTGGRLIFDSLKDDLSTTTALLTVCGSGHGLGFGGSFIPANEFAQWDSLFDASWGINDFMDSVKSGGWTNQRFTFSDQAVMHAGSPPVVDATCPVVVDCDFCNEPGVTPPVSNGITQVDTNVTRLIAVLHGQSNLQANFSDKDGSPPISNLANTAQVLKTEGGFLLRNCKLSGSLIDLAETFSEVTSANVAGQESCRCTGAGVHFWSSTRHTHIIPWARYVIDSTGIDSVIINLNAQGGNGSDRWLGNSGVYASVCGLADMAIRGTRLSLNTNGWDSTDVNIFGLMYGETDLIDLTRGTFDYAHISANYDTLIDLYTTTYPNAQIYLYPPPWWEDFGYSTLEVVRTYEENRDTIWHLFDSIAQANPRVDYMDVIEALSLDTAYAIPLGYNYGSGTFDNSVHYDGVDGQERIAEMAFQWMIMGRREEEP